MDAIRMRTWAEVSLDSIAHNYSEMRSKLERNCRFLGVVKANAYGHGALPTARRLTQLGADYLAVACIDEAAELRRGGIELPILILGYTPPELAEELAELGVTQSVNSLETARELSRRLSGRRLRVHLKADSGMGRMGLSCGAERTAEDFRAATRLPGLEVEGIFTHFAVSDEPDGREYTRAQFEAFMGLAGAIEESGFKFQIKHCANSGAMINYPRTHLDMVRPGIALYGEYNAFGAEKLRLLPAMELRTRVVQVKDVRTGDSVSYGRRWRAAGARRVAVLPIGYADGLPRLLSNRASVLIRGRRVPLIGSICMDMCMADVTELDGVAVGDTVTVFGGDGEEFISVGEQAALAGTIPYELTCSVAPRVKRLYV